MAGKCNCWITCKVLPSGISQIFSFKIQALFTGYRHGINIRGSLLRCQKHLMLQLDVCCKREWWGGEKGKGGVVSVEC